MKLERSLVAATRRLPRQLKSPLGRLHPALQRTLETSPWPALAAGGQVLLARIPRDGPAVLCATSVGSAAHVRAVDSLVAAGLRLRGADSHMLLCDGLLAACEVPLIAQYPRPAEFATAGPRRYCADCFGEGMDFLHDVPFSLHRYSEFVSAEEIAAALAEAQGRSPDECFQYHRNGVFLGEAVRTGVLRLFGSSALDAEDPALLLAAARRYLAAAITTAHVATRIIKAIRPAAIITHHGVYVPQGVLGAVARKMGVRVVTWAPAYRNTTVVYSHDDTYHRTMPHEPRENWEAMAWDAEREAQLDAYLLRRRRGEGDWTWITPVGSDGRSEDQHRIAVALRLDPTKPIFGLLTNIGWDADIFHAGRAFADMFEWLFATIDFFAERPDWQLIVRVHPHEVKTGNRQMAVTEIGRRFASLPANVKLVPHDSELSTYALMDICRAVLVWGTKTAIEIAPTGIPIIVAADAWTRNKGISYDIFTRAEYFDTLARLADLERSAPEQIERARRYAYHFFFRRMIPLNAMDPEAGWPPRLRIRSLEEILPGRDPGLDVICDGILTGKEFIFSP